MSRQHLILLVALLTALSSPLLTACSDDAGTAPTRDMSTSADMQTTRDMTPRADMTLPADMADTTDMTATDMGNTPDMTTTDMATADMTMADMTMADMSTSPTRYRGAGDIYATGALTTSRVSVSDQEAPVSLTIHTPTAPGHYAVIVFQHGFLLSTAFFSGLLDHLASHGFVVVAPQMYAPGGLPLGKPSVAEETMTAAQVHAWLQTNLTSKLPASVTADLDALGLAGHSRGGKVAWGLAQQDPTLAKALAGIDPVDGTGGPLGMEPRVLDTYSATLPTLVLGTGLGPMALSAFQPACAPEGDNHYNFYAAPGQPAWHVIATEYGHLDMLDDDTPGCGLACSSCASGSSRAPMRKLTSGMLTAFFRGILQEQPADLPKLQDDLIAPVMIQTAKR